MTEITQADRDAADEWKWFLYDREDYDPEKQMEKNVADLTADFARHRMEERAAIVEWLRKVGGSGPEVLADMIDAGGHLE